MAEDDLPRQKLKLSPSPARAKTWACLLVSLLPAIGAIAWFPHFVTQDGPAHAASAQILVESLSGRPSPRAQVYEVQLTPLPNWAGHVALGGLIALGVSPRDADRLVMALTLVALAAAIFFLRRQVAGTPGSMAAAALASTMAMNLTWLFGFYSFLIGAALYAATLALWWRDRDRPGPLPSALVAALLVAGYFAHLISLGLTAFALVTLAMATPGTPALKRKRLLWTSLSLLPLVPLAAVYLRLMSQSGGGLSPAWPILQDPTSLKNWWQQLGWIDPISLGSKLSAPFAPSFQTNYFVFSPALWLTLGLLGMSLATWRGRGPEQARTGPRRGFLLIAAVLLLVGLVGPDSLGASHGNYLAQRQVLLGLIALVPLLDLAQRSRLCRLAGFSLLIAVALQAAFVLDYASRSNQVIANVVAAQPLIGPGQRVGMVALTDFRAHFRANPLRHADCLLALENDNIVWGNYEMAHYYFPIQIRPHVPHPPVLAFETISLMNDPTQAANRAHAWESLLKKHHQEIDRIVLYGEGLRERQVASRWYEPLGSIGKITLHARRPDDQSPRLAGQEASSVPAVSAPR